MFRTRILCLIAGAALWAPAAASAASEGEPSLLLPKVGLGATVGGGVLGFTDKGMRDVTDVAGTWTARLVLGTRYPIALEAAYLGSAQSIKTLTAGSALVGNGVEGTFRYNILTGMWQPYVFAGMAYKHYSISNIDRQFSSAIETDEVAEMPLGGGLAFRYLGLIADARIVVRPAFDSNLIANLGDSSLTNWNLNAHVGFEF